MTSVVGTDHPETHDSGGPGSPALERLAVSATRIQAGLPAYATVGLRLPAPTGGVAVALTSDRRDAVQVPDSVTIAEGSDNNIFPLTVADVAQPTVATLEAHLNGATRKTELLVEPLASSGRDASGSAAIGELPAGDEQSKLATVIATLPWLPLAAVGWTLLIYAAPIHLLSPGSALAAISDALFAPLPLLKAHLLFSGAVAGLVSGAVAAFLSYFVLRATSASRANVPVYGELCGRLEYMRVRINWRWQDETLTPAQREALHEAAALHRRACDELRRVGLRWVLATGYIVVWRLVHQSEQVLIGLATDDELASMAAHNELALHDSDVSNRDHLTRLVHRALQAINPDLLLYLMPENALQSKHPSAPSPSPSSSESPETPSPSQASAASEAGTPSAPVASSQVGTPASGRYILRTVRTAIDEFRDGRWSALIRTRNHLLATFALTGVLVYVIVLLAVSNRVADTPADLLNDPIVDGTVLFLVAAVVGLIPRLRGQTYAELAVEDYGLARARLMLTPLLSGLAGVGGVLVVQLIPSFTARSFPGGANFVDAPQLAALLTLSQNSTTLLWSAIFGLTPNLLITLLERGANRLQDQLLRSSAGQATTSSSRGGNKKGTQSGADKPSAGSLPNLLRR